MIKCSHILKVGGFLDRVSQYIQYPQAVNYDQTDDLAHSITRIYFSYQ